jgi:hypothetical protein
MSISCRLVAFVGYGWRIFVINHQRSQALSLGTCIPSYQSYKTCNCILLRLMLVPNQFLTFCCNVAGVIGELRVIPYGLLFTFSVLSPINYHFSRQ